MAHDSLSLRSYGASHGSHAHAHHQVLVGLAGVLDLDVGGRGRRVRAGDAVLVPRGELHDFESARGSRCLVLDSDDALWDSCDTQPQRPQQVLALAGAVARGHAAGDAATRLLQAWLPAQGSARPRRVIDWQALGQWAQDRMQHEIGVADLAAQVHLSASQFAARCHAAQGMRPAAWLRLQRLMCARQMRDGGMAVAEVAQRAGYRSPSALTAALRRCGL